MAATVVAVFFVSPAYAQQPAPLLPDLPTTFETDEAVLNNAVEQIEKLHLDTSWTDDCSERIGWAWDTAADDKPAQQFLVYRASKAFDSYVVDVTGDDSQFSITAFVSSSAIRGRIYSVFQYDHGRRVRPIYRRSHFILLQDVQNGLANVPAGSKAGQDFDVVSIRDGKFTEDNYPTVWYTRCP